MRFRQVFQQTFHLWLAIGWALLPTISIAAAQSASHARPRAAATTAGTAAKANIALSAGASGVLAELASRAAVIFTGQVLSVTPSAGVVDIRFRIDQPIRNCPQNGDYVLREWAGLWTAHPDRYHVGQRALMFLSARGPAGISAPVDVNDGIVPLHATAAQPLADASGKAPADSTSAEMMVDPRWLQTRVSRIAAAPALLHALSTGSSAEETWAGPVTPLAAVPATSVTSAIAQIGVGGSDAQR